MKEGVGMEARVGLGTSTTVVELLGTSDCIRVEDGSFVMGVSARVSFGGCGGGGVEADVACEGVVSFVVDMERGEVTGVRGDGEGI